MIRARTFGIVAVITAAAIAGIFGVCHAIGLRINLTDSAPIGLWHVQPINSVARGELVDVCPPMLPIVTVMLERGYLKSGDCPAGVLSFLKPVAAASGDTVMISNGQPAEVNGYALPSTVSMPSIPGWPDGTYTVDEGHIWLLSTYSAGSFDSRYFGPVPVTNVRGRAVPVLVKGDPANMTRITGGAYP